MCDNNNDLLSPSRANKRIIYAKQVDGPLQPAKVLEIVEDPVGKLDREGFVLIKNLYLSVDPRHLLLLAGTTNLEHSGVWSVGEVIDCHTVNIGQVIESRSASFKPGDLVSCQIGYVEYKAISADVCNRLENAHTVPLTAFLHVLGFTGLTAYYGVTRIGSPKKGDTMVVSTGAVGSIAGQIGKILGCKVIGICGSDEKCKWLKEDLNFDECINYKTERLSTALERVAPKGIDIYFDNVGGEILNTILQHINQFARIVVCGAISQYNSESPPSINYTPILFKSAKMEGLMTSTFVSDWPTGLKQLGEWVGSGKIKYREHLIKGGIESVPQALVMLSEGKAHGKLVVQIGDLETF